MIEKHTVFLKGTCAVAANWPITHSGSSAAPAARKATVLLVEASNEQAAHDFFSAILEGHHPERLHELSRGLLFAQAQESGRYWRFELAARAP